MKKILFVSHEYGIGGSSSSLLSLINGIKKLDKNIEIVVMIPFKFGKNAWAKKLFEDNEINVKQMLYRYNFKNVGTKTSLMKYIHDIWNFMAVGTICRYIKKNKFDIVCSNSSGVDVGARAALKIHIPHIYYVREFMEEDHGFEYRNKKRMKKLLEASGYVIFISKAIEKKYKSLYQLKNIIQFYEGFITENYYIENHNILQKNTIKMIQVGSYGQGKGTLDSIALINSLRKAGLENIDLEFVGNGSDDYKEKMRSLIKRYHLNEHITISPYTNDIKSKLEKSDILLMNSRSEGFGRVTVEGMLSGCLVLGRNSAGTSEIIQDGINGVLYDDDIEFVHCMGKILDNCELYRKLAKEGQKDAMERFNYVTTAKEFLKIVEKCIKLQGVVYERED